MKRIEVIIEELLTNEFLNVGLAGTLVYFATRPELCSIFNDQRLVRQLISFRKAINMLDDYLDSLSFDEVRVLSSSPENTLATLLKNNPEFSFACQSLVNAGYITSHTLHAFGALLVQIYLQERTAAEEYGHTPDPNKRLQMAELHFQLNSVSLALYAELYQHRLDMEAEGATGAVILDILTVESHYRHTYISGKVIQLLDDLKDWISDAIAEGETNTVTPNIVLAILDKQGVIESEEFKEWLSGQRNQVSRQSLDSLPAQVRDGINVAYELFKMYLSSLPMADKLFYEIFWRVVVQLGFASGIQDQS